MSKPNVFERIRSAMDLFGSAMRVASALERHDQPDPRDLRRMGMDPNAFRKLGRG